MIHFDIDREALYLIKMQNESSLGARRKLPLVIAMIQLFMSNKHILIQNSLFKWHRKDCFK